MIWFLDDLRRWRDERLALEALAQRVDWLVPIGWRIDRGTLCLTFDADMTAGGQTRPVSVRYPVHFPHTPVLVLPRGDPAIWSSHQWGSGGELCLEWGTDNWTPEITAAQMVESAYRLLEGEHPVSDERATVASRHAMTSGQELRNTFGRLLVTRALQQALADVPLHVARKANVLVCLHREGTVCIVDKIALESDGTWRESSVPEHLSYESIEREATIFRVPEDADLPRETTAAAFLETATALGCPTDEFCMIFLRGTGVHAYRIHADMVWALALIPSESEARRLDDVHDVLCAKSVAVIGCGSLGSKVAAMLARAGVGRFLLVDDDILLPGNLVRHDLDWRDVGAHKADAVSRRVQLVNSSAVVKVRRMRLGGQEAAGSVEALLASLEGCDLVIDATANPAVFNLLSAIGDRPLIWGEVFGGGIGGLVARYRPDREPPPQYMRLAIENWFADQGKPRPAAATDYETRDDGPPLIADDAAVTTIAAHTARLAIDALIGREPSMFPDSVYAIGMAVGSVFEQPFETYPIVVGPPLEQPQIETLTEEEELSEYGAIRKIFGLANEDPADA